MKKKRGQNSVQRFFGSRFFIIAGLLLAILISVSYIRGYYQDYKIREEIRMLQDEVSQLERKKIESLEILQYVISPDFVEEKARTELGLKKPGENVIVLSKQAHSPDIIETTQEKEEDLNNPRKWWYYFTQSKL